ncbi:ABC transporter permease [Candidatus Woesearchaeota archaeon]|jgi:putative ABC transport system permease protein|nr:ABC transporter permease [Candidatus Woesearchaeota archaeon]MBT3537338.1 ABC transporter permease [Candidatus Woesearchaeota archaeon]MBT4697393.1 ABC transporter permease [Candidatus Woesearchaeota archaeon]MBT4716696.1 ABC transporter permease [Candidatus Woesearchaeota archaeon]MBT7106352.1 ABC transporter permease [Candidatus Woesearchaeota archaeon]
MLLDYLRFALKNLRNRQLRSWLTVLGIVIGIASIVALITVSQGLENSIEEQFEKIGSNRIFISAAGGGDPTARSGLTQKDVDKLEKLPDLEWVTPYLIAAVPVKFGRESLNARISGVPSDDMDRRWGDLDLSLKEGRFLAEGEKSSTLIGIRVSDDMFEKDVRVNTNLKINDKKFKVIGIMDEIGNSDDDNMILVPIETARELAGTPDAVTMIEVVIKNPAEMDRVAQKIQRTLEKVRDEESFEVQTPEQILNQLGSILDIIQVVLVGIAAISLLVGGLGIMNSMYTNVLERTNEIGVMKSIGATNLDIMLMFVFESGVIGLVGGTIGAALGTLISKGVGVAAAAGGFSILKVKVSFGIIILGILFSIIVGILSGAMPARQASKLKPIDALRYD